MKKSIALHGLSMAMSFFFSTERMVALFIEILNISCVKCCYIYFLFKSLKIIYSLSGRQLTGFALNPLVFRSIEIMSNLQVHQFFLLFN